MRSGPLMPGEMAIGMVWVAETPADAVATAVRLDTVRSTGTWTAKVLA
jgi:hypothetical protein